MLRMETRHVVDVHQYQSIHQSERGGGREGRGGRGGHSGRDGHGRGRGRGGCGPGDGEKDDDVKANSRLPYQVYKDLPAGFKKWMRKCGNDKEKGSDVKPSAQDHLANQAELAVPSTVSVSTEATGIMGAVTGGKSTSSNIQHVLSAMRGAATGNRGEYCVAEDIKSMLA